MFEKKGWNKNLQFRIINFQGITNELYQNLSFILLFLISSLCFESAVYVHLNCAMSC